MTSRVKALYHRAFDVGIGLKGLDGLLEVVAGMTLLLSTQPASMPAVRWLTRQALIEDPDDPVANYLLHLVRGLPVGTRHFAGAYLLGHGVVKLALVIGLLRGARWSYPTAIASLSAFIGNPCYRWMQHASFFSGGSEPAGCPHRGIDRRGVAFPTTRGRMIRGRLRPTRRSFPA